MPDELLTIFKLCFLVLLYLFFFRVLRAVWTEVNAATAMGTEVKRPGRRSRKAAAGAAAAVPVGVPAAAPVPAPTAPTAAAGPGRLAAIDPPHLAGIEYPLVDGMSIGRGSVASIVLDDSFLSQRHAAFEQREGHWFVSDLGSTNGTYVNRTKVDQLTRLDVGDQVQVGNVVLEVR